MNVVNMDELYGSESKEFQKIADDEVEHPGHYTHGNIECFDYILDNLGDNNTVAFCLGNCLKYISRCKFKGNMVTDLKKCRWYLSKAIDILEMEKA